MSSTARAPKILLTTFGTHGDLNPFMALGLALKQRGAEPTIAAAELYRAKVESAGIAFAHMRPDLDEVAARLGMEQQAIARAAAKRPEFIVEDVVLPHLRESYDDALRAMNGMDFVVTHSATYGARLAVEKLGLPHIGVVLQPMMLPSAFDPPVVAGMARVLRLGYAAGPLGARLLIGIGRMLARRWARPIEELRAEIGLPKSIGHPLFEGQFSATGALALFSPIFGEPQPDHPPGTRIVGFAFYDSELGERPSMQPELERFLDGGPPPIVFTQGTSAVQDAEHFIRESLEAVRLLATRAVFVLDAERQREWASRASNRILITGYAPYSLLFPRARINVHHGGIGTTAQALRAGRPQLIAPYLVDQPDNAARVARLGAGLTLSLRDYRGARVAQELRTLIEQPAYAQRAREIGDQIAHEDGAAAGAEIILAQLDAARAKLG